MKYEKDQIHIYSTYSLEQYNYEKDRLFRHRQPLQIIQLHTNLLALVSYAY